MDTTGRVTVVGVETTTVEEPEMMVVGVGQYEVVVPMVTTEVVPGRVWVAVQGHSLMVRVVSAVTV